MATAAELMAEEIGRSYQETLQKAAMDTPTMAAASVVRLDFAEQLDIYGNDETPLVSTLGSTVAKAIDHKWEQATRRAAAANKNVEGSAAKAGVSRAPVKASNTCQIVKGTVEVTRSALREAANGIYNASLVDAISWQVEQEMVGIFKDIEYAMLFGVEDTTDVENSARAMKGLIGAVGTYNGFIQTTQSDGSGAALGQTMFDNWLADIWAVQAGRYPDRIYCSLKAKQIIGTFASGKFTLTINPADLGNLTAGMRVGFYEAPWGGLIDIYPHPLCADSATEANNWMLALRTDLIKRADFDPLFTRPLPGTTDAELREILWEGTLECRVEPAHGLLKNFATDEGPGS